MLHRLAAAVALVATLLLCASAHAAGPGRARRRLPRASGVTYWVAPHGSDQNPGTATHPWRTIGKAAAAATPGSTVAIRGGVYAERVRMAVSGSAEGGWITFRAHADERVVLDGSALSAPAGVSAMLAIDGRGWIRVVGLEIASYRTRVRGDVVVGVLITGLAHHVEVLDCTIRDIASTAPVDGDRGGRDAHGLAVYGSSGTTAIHDLLIAGNEVAHCTLGSSEALVVNGNVERFEISDNRVHDNDNIGIDVIGWEGTAPANDQARDGVIRGNHVWGNSAAGNPAYTDLAAGGIYVDGGRDLLVEGNTVHHNDYGIEVGCENPGRAASGVVVRSNLVHHNTVAGIGFGGYDTDRGVTVGCTFRHNTLYHNDTTRTGSGEVVVQVAHGNTFSHNVIVPHDAGVMLTNYFSPSWSHDNVFDRNLYSSAGGPGSATFVWQDEEYPAFEAFRAASGQDAHSLFADPLLADPGLPDLHLRAGSPAVDAGDPAFAPAEGERDLDGEPRVCGGRVDLGADERCPPATGPPPARTRWPG
ncbi:MAG: right-handed parallel beta-helix repeat-containing protein [Thermoanaerobaculaceae bacterium]